MRRHLSPGFQRRGQDTLNLFAEHPIDHLVSVRSMRISASITRGIVLTASHTCVI